MKIANSRPLQNTEHSLNSFHKMLYKMPIHAKLYIEFDAAEKILRTFLLQDEYLALVARLILHVKDYSKSIDLSLVLVHLYYTNKNP